MSNPLFTLRELVQMMQETTGADYSNWGLSVANDTVDEIFIGPEQKDMKLIVPLIDIVDCATESYPLYGLEEIFFLFGTDEQGGLEWGIVRRE